MGAAAKFMIRQPLAVVPNEPERLSEDDALRVIVSATGGTACPFHEVSPLANHLRGPIAAVPPEGHPDWSALRSYGPMRSTRTVDGLTMDACGHTGPVRCTCDDQPCHPLLLTMRHLSQGKIVRAPVNTGETQEKMLWAWNTGDVDRLTYYFEPRLDVLKLVADRARAEHGGDLPEVVVEAVVLLAQTLTGPRRWDIRTGYTMYDWPIGYRIGKAFEDADVAMRRSDVHDRVILRLVEGR